MSFTEQDKLKAMAIVHIFETSKALGDYAACVVLNDGAGVSYGINQFTHRAGSLEAVVVRYLMGGGTTGREVLSARLADLRVRTTASIKKLSSDAEFKRALRMAAATKQMQAAQRQIAFERYLRPALEMCEALRFSQPLSLAVVYDSLVHGSWDRIASKVARGLTEKDWVLSYLRKRHMWLTNVPRLKVTNVRTKFFLDQIAVGNWEMRLPMIVHGYRLSSVSEPSAVSAEQSDERVSATGSVFETAGGAIGIAAEKFDRVEAAVSGFVTRKDAAKSLWTTIVGTVWQAVWAVFGFFIGLPKEVWIVVAVVAALLMLAYLYRQITLGQIREEGRVTGDEGRK